MPAFDTVIYFWKSPVSQTGVPSTPLLSCIGYSACFQLMCAADAVCELTQQCKCSGFSLHYRDGRCHGGDDKDSRLRVHGELEIGLNTTACEVLLLLPGCATS